MSGTKLPGTWRMTNITRCPHCNWKWRHYEQQLEEADRKLLGHTLRNCIIGVDCPSCGAIASQLCVSSLGNPTRTTHKARRDALAERESRRRTLEGPA